LGPFSLDGKSKIMSPTNWNGKANNNFDRIPKLARLKVGPVNTKYKIKVPLT